MNGRSPHYRFACVLLAAGLFGTAGTAMATPRIRVAEPTFNFGEADSTQVVEHTFVIENTGTSELEILHVRSSCGCTIGNLSASHIPPGGKSELLARLNLRGRSGPQRHTITLETNDPEQNRFQLRIAGTAATELEVRPERVFFGPITPGENPEQEVTIISRAGRPIQITGVDSDSEHFTAEVEPFERDGSYRVRIRPRNLPPGMSHGNIRLATTSRSRPHINIPVTADVVGALAVAPTKIALRPLGDGQTVTRYVVVRPGRVRSFELVNVEPPDPSIAVHVSPMPPHGYRIQLSNITPHTGLHGTHIRIETDVEDMREIEIPIEIVQ